MIRLLLYSFLTLVIETCPSNTHSTATRPGTTSFLFHFNKPVLLQSPSRDRFQIHGRLTRELYKTIRRRIQEVTETPEKRHERIQKVERSKRDGLLCSPKTSYSIYIALDNRPPDELKRRFKFIAQRLTRIGAEDASVYYHGLKKLVRPLKKRYEACFVSFELAVYPSLIEHIRISLLQEPNVLRVLVLRNAQRDKERRIHRESQLHVRHPYFHTEVFSPLKCRLVNKPGQEFELTKETQDSACLT